MSTKSKLGFVGIKMSKNFIEAIDEYVNRDTHSSRSEFIRTAIREKFQRDAPELWARILKNINAEGEVEVTK